jgi:hypothetical protein
MDTGAVAEARQFLAGRPVATAVLERVIGIVDQLGPADMRVSRSQIAFWRRHGFAYLWRPRQYLARGAEIVLSIALGRHDASPRFKEVAHPSPKHWLHHLEIDDPGVIDQEVADWLREAFDRAG